MRTAELRALPDPADIEADWLAGALRIEEAVRHSGVSRAELYRRMDAGQLAFTKQGRSRLISKTSLARMLAQGDPRSTL